ncbi:hypothetical protein MJD09_05800 [bacterium]|nr:hypothetical protein [bacterium]
MPVITAEKRKAALLNELDNLKHSTNEFLARLKDLNKADLLKLSKMLNQPIRSNAKVDEIKNELLRSFRSEEIWKGNIGTRRLKLCITLAALDATAVA